MKKLLLLPLLAFPVFVLAQNVGIGTTTPTAKLEVKNPGRSVLKISSNDYTDSAQLIISNRNALNQGTDYLLTSPQEEGLFLTSTSDLPANTKDSIFSILMNGNVGIGKKSPSHRLQVHNPSSSNTVIHVTNISTQSGPADGLLISMNSLSASIINTEGNNLQLGTSNLARVTIDALGNVGIGTISPDDKLDVEGNILVSGGGEINRTSTTTANLVPIAYGNISSTGFIQTGTGNFTVSHTITGFYQITITGEAYQFQQYITVVTPIGTIAPRIACTGSGGGALQVSIYDITGAAVDGNFHFVVYKQ